MQGQPAQFLASETLRTSGRLRLAVGASRSLDAFGARAHRGLDFQPLCAGRPRVHSMERMAYPEPGVTSPAAHRADIVIGGVRVGVTTSSASFLGLLRERYAGFLAAHA